MIMNGFATNITSIKEDKLIDVVVPTKFERTCFR